MESQSPSTSIRVKNSFSIDDILSRPDNSASEHHRRLMRQDPFQNNHVLFCGSSVNQPQLIRKSLKANSDNKVETVDSEDQNIIQDQDHETNSEAASDDGSSSVHSEC